MARHGIGRLRAGGSWFPSFLFAAGEQGAWYDASDFSTQFQDSAGTTPVTAAGQPVGLVLDKHLGLAIGADKVTNGDAASGSTTGWNAGFNVTTSSIVASGGAFTLTSAGADASPRFVTTLTGLTVGQTCKITWRDAGGSGTGDRIVVWTSVADGTGGSVISQVPAATAAAGTKTVYATATAATMYLAFGLQATTNGSTNSWDDTVVRALPGNHLVQATAASRPTIQQDASGYWYWSFDGVDDSWATAATVDFSATDKIALFVGVRKASDAAGGMLVELTTNANTSTGGFYVSAPETTGNYGFVLHGDASVSAVSGTGWTASGFAAPISNVVTLLGDIAGADRTTEVVPRINGVVTQSATLGGAVASAGAGNLSNSTLYVGRRGGATSPINGRIYQLIARGAAASAAQTTQAERFVGNKMGIAL